MKVLRIMLLIALLPSVCDANSAKTDAKSKDAEDVRVASLWTDYADQLQFGAEKRGDASNRTFYGLQIPFLGFGTCTSRLCGVQIGLFNEVYNGAMSGLQAGIINRVRCVWNGDDVNANGLQLGLVNYVETKGGTVSGVFCQIGLVNILKNGKDSSYWPLVHVRW